MDKRYLNLQLTALRGISKGERWFSSEIEGVVYLSNGHAFWAIPKADYYLDLPKAETVFDRLVAEMVDSRPAELTKELIASLQGILLRVVTNQTARYFYDEKYIRTFPDKNVEYCLGKGGYPMLFVFEHGKLLGGILPVKIKEE